MLDVIKIDKTVENNRDKFNLCGIGDIHKGQRYHDKEVYARNLDWLVRNKEWELLLMGDMIECSSKHSKGLPDQILTVDEQIDSIVEDFGEIADEGRIWGLLQGNHELRALEHAGIDAAYRIAKELKIKYLGTGAAFYLHVNNEGSSRGQNYTIYAQHGSSGASSPGGKLNAVLRLDKIVANCDVYMMGHVHALDHHKEAPTIVDRGNGRLLLQHYILTGSYLQYYGSYAHRKAYAPSGPSGSARIFFHIDRHLISVKV